MEEQDLPRFHRTQTRDICLFIYSLFPRLNCTICPAMKKGIEKTVFLRFTLLLLSFWEVSQGTEKNHTVRVRP